MKTKTASKEIILNYKINGMHCASCENIIVKVLKKNPQIKEVQINLVNETALITLDSQTLNQHDKKSDQISANSHCESHADKQSNTDSHYENHINEQINQALKKYGYSMTQSATQLISRPQSQSTASSLAQSQSTIPSLAQAKSRSKTQLTEKSTHDDLARTQSNTDTNSEAQEKLRQSRKVAITMSVVIVITLIEMFWKIGAQNLNIWQPMSKPIADFFHHLMPLMAFWSLFIVGKDYLSAVVKFFKYKVANMNTLIGIGTTTAFLYSFILSAFKTLLENYLDTTQNYYDVTIIVIGFVILGKYLEQKTKTKTNEAIQKLTQLQAKEAIVIKNGKEVLVAIDQVRIDDIVAVKPGSSIPVDGIVVEGSCAVDESSMTGESLPVDKQKNDLVRASTINLNGYIQVKTTHTGKDTLLAKIIDMVIKAQSSKAPIQRYVDKIASIFTPAVMILALLTLIGWLSVGTWFLGIATSLPMAVGSFASILIIACPCALGLATPLSIVAATGKAAQNGILIKNATILEKLSEVDMVVFDKTNTLTTGRIAVTDTVVENKLEITHFWQLLASLEKKSEHPLAQAIIHQANKTNTAMLKVKDFHSLTGMGVSGKINNTQYFAGNQSLAKKLKLNFNQNLINDWASQGKTPVILMTKDLVLGYISLQDTLNPQAHQLIDNIHQKNIRTMILSGDMIANANYIADKIGVKEVIGQVLPDQKAEVIAKLKQEGRTVMMVGDGINDAVALSIADVGVCLSKGSDIAIDSADVTIIGEEIIKISKVLNLAKKTKANIKQNLFWAFFYNTASIPIASGIFYPLFGIVLTPVIAAIAMSTSSIFVVLNSLRLKNHIDY